MDACTRGVVHMRAVRGSGRGLGSCSRARVLRVVVPFPVACVCVCVCVCDNIMYRYGMCEYELMIGVELFTLLYLAFVFCFLATLF